MNNIHLFIGLPGSGKTHMAKQLQLEFQSQHSHSLLIDDLFIQLRDNNFNWQKVFNLSSEYNTISKNDTYKLSHYIITDFLPCTQEQQLFLFNKLSSLLPEHNQIWNFFENDYQQCFNNISQRKENNNVFVTLELMHKQYQISDFIIQHAQCYFHNVYNSQTNISRSLKKS